MWPLSTAAGTGVEVGGRGTGVAVGGLGVSVGGTGVGVFVSPGVGVSVGCTVSVGVSVGALVAVGVTGAGVSVGVGVSITTMMGVGTTGLAGAAILATTSGVGDAVGDVSAMASVVGGGVAVGVEDREGAAVPLSAKLPAGDASPALAAAPFRRSSRPPIVPRHRNNTPNRPAPCEG